MWLIIPLALVLTPLSIRSIFLAGFSPLYLFTLTPALAVFVILWSIYTSSKKSFQSVKAKIKWRFSEDGYENSTSVGTSNCRWESLEEVEELNKDFLLYPQKPIFIILPKRFFKSESQISEFRELVHENLGDKAKLKK